jgi:hypothetical protein
MDELDDDTSPADDPGTSNGRGRPAKRRHEQDTGPQKAARTLDRTVAPPRRTRPRPRNTSPVSRRSLIQHNRYANIS